jgi:ATP dependent DNA ligase domain
MFSCLRFDLLEMDGRDLRRQPIEDRKAALAKLLRGAKPGMQLNEYIDEPGDIVFRHACKLGLESIVSKRLGSPYRSGRSRDWTKLKNPAYAAVKREAERIGDGDRSLLQKAQAIRAGARGDEDYDVIGPDGMVIGRICEATASPVGTPWMCGY